MTTLQSPATDLSGLARRLVGDLFLPGEPGYAELATPWNVAVPSTPVAVVAAAAAEDVAAAVRFAATHGLELRVQATGHGATPATRPGLLVHTGRLDGLTVDESGLARIGAGVRWDRVIAAGAPLGRAALAGSSPDVGVVGFLTGGGIGPLARTYGVTADHVVAFEVVTGDGEIRRASATENPALFWGLRGGKGALGVVTAVELQLVELGEFLGGCVYFAGEDASSVLHAWREWTAGLPEQATSSVAIMRVPAVPGVPEPLAGRVTVAVRFAWVGDEAAGHAVLAPMLAAGRIVLGGVGMMPYTALGTIHNDPVDPMPTLETGGLLAELAPATVDALIALAGPQAQCPQIIVELRHLGGAIARTPEVASAYVHRDAAYSVLAIGIGVPPVVEATAAHGVALLRALEPWTTGACLPNFVASSDPDEVARKYDAATLTRLASLAAAYDPRGVLAAAAPVRAAACR